MASAARASVESGHRPDNRALRPIVLRSQPRPGRPRGGARRCRHQVSAHEAPGRAVQVSPAAGGRAELHLVAR